MRYSLGLLLVVVLSGTARAYTCPPLTLVGFNGCSYNNITTGSFCKLTAGPGQEQLDCTATGWQVVGSTCAAGILGTGRCVAKRRSTAPTQ